MDTYQLFIIIQLFYDEINPQTKVHDWPPFLKGQNCSPSIGQILIFSTAYVSAIVSTFFGTPYYNLGSQ